MANFLANYQKPSGAAELLDIKRRAVLAVGVSACLGSPLYLSSIASARSTTAKHLVFVNLRGGLDGIDFLRPVFDRDYDRLRGREEKALTGSELRSFQGQSFALHPSQAVLAEWAKSGKAVLFHAVGTPYEGRSHFDAQQVLESAGSRPYATETGFLGRLLVAGHGSIGARGALALGGVVPIVLKGSPAERIQTWSPSSRDLPEDETLDRLARMYRSDAALRSALEAGVGLASTAGPATTIKAGPQSVTPYKTAARLTVEQGAAVLAVDILGWDSHANQFAAVSQYQNALRRLDLILQAIQDGMGAAWGQTVLVATTEFGRTVTVNGTNGTDHGKGSVAFIAGGAVSANHPVYAEWPGLSEKDLVDGRELRPTISTHAATALAIQTYLGLSIGQVAELLPHTKTLQPTKPILAI